MAYVIVLCHRADSCVDRKATLDQRHYGLAARLARIPVVQLARKYSGIKSEPTSTPVHSLDRDERISFVVRAGAEECRADAGWKIRNSKGRIRAMSDVIYVDNSDWQRLRSQFTYDSAAIVAVLDRYVRERE